MTSLDTTTILAALAAPFSITDLEVRPGAVSGDKTSALALAYADWRVYLQRLDTIAGPDNWSIQLLPWGERRVIARLTILGVTKDATGEGDADDPNCGTIAEAQAKKRACAEFGLGRYLYQLPRVWGQGEGDRKQFRFAKGEAERCLATMYQRAGLSLKDTSRSRGSADLPDSLPAPTDRRSRAQAALDTAETRVGLRPTETTSTPKRSAAPATMRQCSKIADLVRPADSTVLAPITAHFEIDLSRVKRTEQVEALGLTKATASAIIDALLALGLDH